MATSQKPRPRQPTHRSWYDIVAAYIEALISKYGLEDASAQVYRAYELICRTSLNGDSAGSATRSSTLNHDGTPIQFALTLGLQAVPLQFLSEVGDPRLSPSESNELVEDTIRNLSALLRLRGDSDSVFDVIHRASAASAFDLAPDRGRTFWVGAGFTTGEKSTVKIYINGKSGPEKERWLRLENFTKCFGVHETYRAVRQIVADKMAPLGMAISLSQNQNPTGRIYFSGYGNLVSYYEYLIRHLGGEQYTDSFRQFSKVMLEEDRDYPTQSAVFSVGIGPGPEWPMMDMKVEFCCHCLFQGDAQAKDRCLRWLTLRKIDAEAYTDMLDVVAGKMSSTRVNTHVFLGQGWKKGKEYTAIYLKPHRRDADIAGKYEGK